MDYYIMEEQPVESLVGNVVIDFGLDLKYEPAVLSGLRFNFLSQSNSSAAQYFSIDDQSGIIRTRTRIDREAVCPKSDQCTLKLDITVQPIRYFQILKIKVELMDENDNAPEFQESRITQQLSETAEAGSGFVIPGAVDPDSNRNGIQSYELVPSIGPFELRMRRTADGETELKVVLKYRLDREYSPVHQVVVTAIDGGSPPKSGTITVDITVLDANDNKPQFTRALYEVRVSEDAPVGTVLLTVEAHDRDEGLNAQVIYYLSTHSAQEFGQMFGVGPESGKLYLKMRLDYETVSTYALSIVARDKGVDAVPTYATVAIHVQDVNDNQPTITVNTLTIDGRAEVMENSEAGDFRRPPVGHRRRRR